MSAGRWAVLGIAPVLAWASAARAEPDLSGSYVGVSDAAAIMIQIVETPDGHVSGHYEALNFAAGGQLVDRTATLDGAAHAGVLVVTIRVSDGRPPISASGSVSGGALHIAAGTAPGDLNLTLKLGDEAAFTAKAASLHQQAAQLASAQAEQRRIQEQVKNASDFIVAVEAFITKQDRYAAQIDVIVSKMEAATPQYRRITESMRDGLNRERSILGDGQASVARSQISVGLSQTSIQTDQLHGNFVSAHNNASQALTALAADTATARSRCARPVEPSPVCAAFAQSADNLSRHAANLQRTFEAAEAVRRQQKAVQDGLVRASEAAE